MMQPGTDELIPTRATLLQRLKNWKDQASWQDFFDTYWKLIYNIARKSGLTETEAQDVVQETMMGVAKQMPTFKYNPEVGTFKAWLLNLTRWRINDQLRKRQASAVTEALGEEPNVYHVIDPSGQTLDEMWQAEWEKALLEAAIDRVKRRLDPKNYQIFDLYVNRNWEAAKVAQTLGVSMDQVYVAKHRVTEMIKEEVKRLETEMT